MSTLGPGDASWAMPGLMFVTGMLFGFSAGPAQTGEAMTLFNVQRQAGQAIGVAVLATVLAATRPVPLDLAGYHLARRDGVRVGHRLPGQGRRRGRDDGPRLKLTG
jgi:hypothetical protein